MAFADVRSESDGPAGGDAEDGNAIDWIPEAGKMTVKQERLWKAKTAHWLAVGSKDAKISLWDIY